jgi:hypothetical protein
MSTNKHDGNKDTESKAVTEHSELERDFSDIGASASPAWNKDILLRTCMSVTSVQGLEEIFSPFDAVLAGLQEIAPKSAAEAMIAAQLIATHHAAMDCLSRAANQNQSTELRMSNLAMATKLSRTWTALLTALDRHRGKGEQRVTVKHVHVHDGGQAVVGSVDTARGDRKT